jgi:membrane protease YdiL (CAAX protease family)
MTLVSKNSLVIPMLLAIAAPLAVILGIERLRSVWWTFAMYQVTICLVAPAIESWLTGRSWRQHATLLGLSNASDDRPRSHHWKPAIILGLVTALVTGGFLVLTRARFLDPERLESTVAGWGVPPEQILMMLAVMAVLNAAAEELFWRGYFPGRMMETRPGSPPPIALTVILPALLYASYHVATIIHLVGDISGVVIMTGGVLAAGLFWGWLRQRTRSVWPPLLSHGGGVLAYLAVHLWLTSVGAS